MLLGKSQRADHTPVPHQLRRRFCRTFESPFATVIAAKSSPLRGGYEGMVKAIWVIWAYRLAKDPCRWLWMEG